MFEIDMVVFVIIGIFFLLIGYRPPWWTRKQNVVDCKKTIKNIPGPFALPVFGTRWVYSRWFGGYSMNKVHEFYASMFRQHGTVIKEESLWNLPIVSLIHRSDIEKVFRHSGRYPMRPPTEVVAHYRRTCEERYASIGLANEQGPAWHKLRVGLTTELTSTRTINEFLAECTDIAVDWCKLLSKVRNTETNVVHNLEALTARLGLESTCALVLGRRMGFLDIDHPSEQAENLSVAVHELFKACSDTSYGLPLWKLFPTESYKRLVKSEEDIYTIVTELIQQSSDSSLITSRVFQSVLNAPLDQREKHTAIVDFIAAGIHTLSNSLLFLLDLVGRDREVQRKLFEQDKTAYVKGCIAEAFRVSPTASIVARILERDLELGGYHLDAGSVVLCHTGLACLDDDNFPAAGRFRPERWLGAEKNATVNAATYLVTPFGIGRRSCPGKRFVEQILAVVLAQVVASYEFSCTKDLDVKFEFLLSPEGPVDMTFVSRE